jgi:hypothetical protein
VHCSEFASAARLAVCGSGKDVEHSVRINTIGSQIRNKRTVRRLRIPSGDRTLQGVCAYQSLLVKSESQLFPILSSKVTMSFAAITLCVASQRVFIVVYFVIDSVRKPLDISSYHCNKAEPMRPYSLKFITHVTMTPCSLPQRLKQRREITE